ncbi:MAG: hypothetical protein K0V04_20780 [Deltaproteobacteria bacterium]|nr:hypothetical protein [Deltaproteobacteria bacterium]
MSIAAMAMGGWLAIAPATSPTRVVVSTEACDGLSDAEVGRLLDIELAMVTTEIREGPPLEVRLRCEPERMTISVVDPLTRKRLARDIPAPTDELGRERVVALAISQLFAASWLELLTTAEPPEPPPGDPPTAPDPPAVDAARRVAQARTDRNAEPDAGPQGRELELLLGAGGRGRALESSGRLAAARLELSFRGWFRPSIGVVGLVGYDIGQRTRRLGQVRGQAVTAGGGLAWAWRPDRARARVGVGGQVVVAGGWARVRGVPREPAVPAGSVSGLTAEVAAGVGPRVHYGRLRFDIDGELGLMSQSPTGRVEDGPAMTLGGLWMGLVLRLGGALR